MKEIKDYLPLYQKVPILICEPGIEPVSHYLEGYDWYLGKAIAERVSYDPSWIKPILRPLSSMTEEEMNEAIKIGGLRYYRGGSVTDFITGWSAFSAENFIYLLSKHFDLFGLIDAGLAIDSTKHPAKN